jgi:hypothetical protein
MLLEDPGQPSATSDAGARLAWKMHPNWDQQCVWLSLGLATGLEHAPIGHGQLSALLASVSRTAVRSASISARCGRLRVLEPQSERCTRCEDAKSAYGNSCSCRRRSTIDIRRNRALATVRLGVVTD